MRTYEQLVSDDPAWPAIAEQVATASVPIAILPRDPAAARACLEALQVTTRSPLGAFAHETGGMLVDHGWLRLFGSGHPSLSRTLGGWNTELGVPLDQFLILGDDVVGGVFAINAGGLGPARGNVHYFAPDCLEWEDLELGHTDFVGWVLGGDLATFYATMRWPTWQADVEQLGGDRSFHLHPPLWTEEGKNVAKVSRRAVSASELWRFQTD